MISKKKFTVIQKAIPAAAYWGDIWRHRDLLYFLVWRDILIRYKQTVVGFSWVLIRPILTMIILSVVFGRIANLSSGDIPYSVLVFSGLLPWFYFSNALSECSNSLVTNSNLLSKVYFPRLIVPASTIVFGGVDFFISIAVLLLLMFWHGIKFSWTLLLLPALGIWVGLLAFGLGLWLATLTVRFRDFRHIVPFLLQLGVYASPVGYDASLIPENIVQLYYLNPIAGVIDAFRWSIMNAQPNLYGLASAGIMTLALLITGLKFFRSEESKFADDI